MARSTLIAIAIAAALAWIAAGMVITRMHATKLPAIPDRTELPEPVADEIAQADAAARSRPTSAAVVGDLGIVYHASLRPIEAQQAYAIAEALDPPDWRWTYYRGLLFEEHGDHLAALDAFTRVTAQAPDHGVAHFHIAEIQFKLGRLDEAAAAYAAARDAPPNDSDAGPGRPARRGRPLSDYANAGLARIALERGNQPAKATPSHSTGTARARAYVPPVDPLLDDLVARSVHTDLLLKHAALAARGGDPVWREWLTRRALSVNPRGFDVLLEMATMLQASGKHTEALTFLQQCEEVAPGDHHTLVAQGKSLIELGRLDEAENVLRRAVRFRDAAAEYNLATVLDRMDKWGEARTHYERALEIDPFHARAMNNLAIGLDLHGQTVAALALFTRALQAGPDNETLADAHNNRGIALARLQRTSEARQAFEKALQIDPGHRDARRNLDAISALSAR